MTSSPAHTGEDPLVFFTAVGVEDATLAPVAAALHGTVLQTLALMRWQLDDPGAGPDELRERIREAETELRLILGTIRPCNDTDDQQCSLSDLATTYMRFYDTKIRCRSVGYLPASYRHAVHQLTRRALAALVVGAKATEVSITLRGDEQLLVDIVGLCDVGNDERWAKPLTYLNDRLRLIGGSAEVSGDQTTTRIQLSAPLLPELEHLAQQEADAGRPPVRR